MKTNTILLWRIIGSIVLLLIVGCATGPLQSIDTAAKGPAWVTKGTGAFDVDGAMVFYGVGAASGIKNKALLRQTADNRARAEIAKTLEVYVATLSKDYMASTSGTEISNALEEQHVEIALKSFTKKTLHGSRIVDRWQDPADKTMYSLCEMDLLMYKKAAEEERMLDRKLREYIKENAERMHSELEKMEK